jgi:hypothetical protein
MVSPFPNEWTFELVDRLTESSSQKGTKPDNRHAN